MGIFTPRETQATDTLESAQNQDKLSKVSTQDSAGSASDKRIYVVLAETTRGLHGWLPHPCGRAAAQAAHVVSRMRVEDHKQRMMDDVRELVKQHTSTKYDVWDHINHESFAEVPAITTIILAVETDAMLRQLGDVLSARGVNCEEFVDSNDEYRDGEALTAICTYPVDPVIVAEILAALPLWEHGQNIVP